MANRDVLVSWLNDAYAMEIALIPILENHAKDAKDYPAMQARIEEHVDETRRQSEAIKSCIERLGASVSTTKKTLGWLFGIAQAPATAMAADELVKNVLMDIATENFEIASYEALVVAAQQCGEPEIAATCEQILTEERRMAEGLREHLPTLVQGYCRRANRSPL